MPLIRFDSKKDDGFYLLATNGEIGCYAHHVYWATDLLLRQLDPLFQEKGIRYHRLTQEEADQLLKPANNHPSPKAS